MRFGPCVTQGTHSAEVDKITHLEKGLEVQASVLVDVRRRAVYIVNLKVKFPLKQMRLSVHHMCRFQI